MIHRISMLKARLIFKELILSYQRGDGRDFGYIVHPIINIPLKNSFLIGRKGCGFEIQLAKDVAALENS